MQAYSLSALYFGYFLWKSATTALCFAPADGCCSDRPTLQRMNRELEEATGVSLYLADELSSGVQLESLQVLDLEFPPAAVYAPQVVADACGSLRQDIGSCEVEGRKVVGVDAEWEIGAAGRKKVATIQIAPLRGTPFVFHVQTSLGLRRRRSQKPSSFFSRTAVSSRWALSRFCFLFVSSC